MLIDDTIRPGKTAAVKGPLQKTGGAVSVTLVLKVGTTSFELTGTSQKGMLQVYYSMPMDQAIDLGTPADALLVLGQTLLGKDTGQELYNDIFDFINSLPDLLGEIIKAFLNAHIVITKLNILTGEGMGMTFDFQIGLLFAKPPSVAGVSLEYFLFEYSKRLGSKATVKLLQDTGTIIA